MDKNSGPQRHSFRQIDRPSHAAGGWFDRSLQCVDASGFSAATDKRKARSEPIMDTLKTKSTQRTRLAVLAFLLLAFLAGVALCRTLDLGPVTMNWDGDDYGNPLVSLLGVALAGGAASVVTLLVFTVGIGLAVAGAGLLAAVAIAVGIVVLAAIVLAIVLPLLPIVLFCLPLVALWLLLRRRSGKKDSVTVAG